MIHGRRWRHLLSLTIIWRKQWPLWDTHRVKHHTMRSLSLSRRPWTKCRIKTLHRPLENLENWWGSFEKNDTMKISSKFSFVAVVFVCSLMGCSLFSPTTYNTADYQAIHEA